MLISKSNLWKWQLELFCSRFIYPKIHFVYKFSVGYSRLILVVCSYVIWFKWFCSNGLHSVVSFDDYNFENGIIISLFGTKRNWMRKFENSIFIRYFSSVNSNNGLFLRMWKSNKMKIENRYVYFQVNIPIEAKYYVNLLIY